MATRPDDEGTNIPKRMYDSSTETIYKRLQFVAEGGFSKCYEIMDVSTNDVYAGKIVSKKLMMKHNKKEQMTQAITIHKSLSHPNIVKFHGFFDDIYNIYIVLELCKNRSMMQLQKRRKTITEYECRYYIYQIIQGVKYLHHNRIIHRFLTLSNLFLNDQLHVKIGDFSLATRIEYDGECKKTLCGTPNYIAPEIFTKQGHSFEVDIWSIGCVMYTLLVGQLPFQAKTLEDTCSKIKKCEFKVPSYLHKFAAEMIIAMLQLHPEKRPTAGALLHLDFFKVSPVPMFLASSCLTLAPCLGLDETIGPEVAQRLETVKDDTSFKSKAIKNNLHDETKAFPQAYRQNKDFRQHIENLHQELTALLLAKPKLLHGNLGDKHTDPAAQPFFWITKCTDCSDKYGLGYQLCDESLGVRFNDKTKLLLLPNGHDVHFIDKDGMETYMTTTNYLMGIANKMKLLLHFKHIMTEHLATVGSASVRFGWEKVHRPHLHSWYKSEQAVLMHMSNGLVQLNFLGDMKIMLCPRMGAVISVDSEAKIRTYLLSTVKEHGCSKDLYQKLCYAHEQLKKILAVTPKVSKPKLTGCFLRYQIKQQLRAEHLKAEQLKADN